MRQHILAQWFQDEPLAMFGLCAGYAPSTFWATTVAPDCNTMQVNQVGLILDQFSYRKNALVILEFRLFHQKSDMRRDMRPLYIYTPGSYFVQVMRPVMRPIYIRQR